MKTPFLSRAFIFFSFVLFLLFIFSCNKDDNLGIKSFEVTVSKDLLGKTEYPGIFITNQKGELLHTQILQDNLSAQDLRIQFDKASDDNICFTLVKYDAHNISYSDAGDVRLVTYFNIPNQAFINNEVENPSPGNNITRTLKINGVTSFQHARMGLHDQQSITNYELIDDQLRLQIEKPESDFESLLYLKVNGKDRQYLKIEDGQDILPEKNIDDLSSDLVTQTLKFGAYSAARGDVYGVIKETGKRLILGYYDHAEMSSPFFGDVNGNPIITIPGDIEFDFFEFDIKVVATGSTEQRFRNFPAKINFNSNYEMIVHSADTSHFSITGSSGLDLFRINFKLYDDPIPQFDLLEDHTRYSWSMYGIIEDDQIDFNLPKIPDELMAVLPKLENPQNPLEFLDEVNFKLGNWIGIQDLRKQPDASFWKTPNIIFKRDWRMEHGIKNKGFQLY